MTPRSQRGARTRAVLVAAARAVFERDGYVDARITDITKQAKVASGSFYTYFESKEEIFGAVVEQVQEDMLHARTGERPNDEDVFAQISAANRDYLLSYKENARLMALFEQVTQIDEEFRELRRKRTAAFVRRNAKLIRRLQKNGRADPGLDPLIAAHALSAMVARMAYAVFVLNEKIPFERLVANLDQIWANALKLDQEPLPAKSERASASRA